MVNLDLLGILQKYKPKGIIDMRYDLYDLINTYSEIKTKSIVFAPVLSTNIILQGKFKDRIESNNMKLVALGLSKAGIEESTISISVGDYGAFSTLKVPYKIALDYPNINFLGMEHIKLVTLDKFMVMKDLSYDFIILNTNGSEYDILKDSQKTLNNIDFLYINSYKEPYFKNMVLQDELNSFLEGLGFRLEFTNWQNDNWGKSFYTKG